MEEKAFIEKQRDTIESVEVELLAVVKKAKTDLDVELNRLRQETYREIERARADHANIEEKLNKTILDLRKKVDYFRNGVYKKYFDKINTTKCKLESSRTYEGMIKSLNEALTVLEQYEDSIRPHKFLIDLFKQTISNACRQAEYALSELRRYESDICRADERQLKHLISGQNGRLAQKEKKLRSEIWEQLEGEIDRKLSDVLSIIIGD